MVELDGAFDFRFKSNSIARVINKDTWGSENKDDRIIEINEAFSIWNKYEMGSVQKVTRSIYKIHD